MTSTGLPDYDELPRRPDDIAASWGVFDREDLAALNLLGPERVKRATEAVIDGEVIPLNLPLDEPSPTLFGRAGIAHRIEAPADHVRDDYLEFNTQLSTQWDGLRHMKGGAGFYGGHGDDVVDDPSRLGIDHWARLGIVGRGVLLDVAGHLAEQVEYRALEPRAISATELEEVAAAQKVEILPGDILCLRLGWSEAFRRLDESGRARYSADPQHAGLDSGEEIARLLWEWHVAALPCDNPTVEVFPIDRSRPTLHMRLIPGLGLALGELFDFEDLVAACRRDQRWKFLFSSVPLNVPGGVGSPANAVAIR